MVKKYKIVLIAFFILSIISGCGYEPLAGKKDKNFSIERFEISGDKRLGRILSNNINTSSGKSNQLYLNIKSKKSRKISNKSTTGKILEYTIDISFEINAINILNKKTVYSKIHSKKVSYKASDLYFDTLSNEKKLINNATKNIANQILMEINLIYSN